MDERIERQIVRSLQLLFEGKLSDAERVIEGMERRAKGTELNGYVAVLKGIFLSYTTDDRTSLLHRIYSSDDPKRELESYVKAMSEADVSFDDARSPVVEVWEAILRNFEKLPFPHRFRPSQEEKQQRLD